MDRLTDEEYLRKLENFRNKLILIDESLANIVSIVEYESLQVLELDISNRYYTTQINIPKFVKNIRLSSKNKVTGNITIKIFNSDQLHIDTINDYVWCVQLLKDNKLLICDLNSLNKILIKLYCIVIKEIEYNTKHEYTTYMQLAYAYNIIDLIRDRNEVVDNELIHDLIKITNKNTLGKNQDFKILSDRILKDIRKTYKKELETWK